MAAFNFQSGGRNTPQSEEAASPAPCGFCGGGISRRGGPSRMRARGPRGRPRCRGQLGLGLPTQTGRVSPVTSTCLLRSFGCPTFGCWGRLSPGSGDRRSSGGLKLNTLASTCTNSRSCTISPPPPHVIIAWCVQARMPFFFFLLSTAAASPSTEPAAFRVQDQTVSSSW